MKKIVKIHVTLDYLLSSEFWKKNEDRTSNTYKNFKLILYKYDSVIIRKIG